MRYNSEQLALIIKYRFDISKEMFIEHSEECYRNTFFVSGFYMLFCFWQLYTVVFDGSFGGLCFSIVGYRASWYYFERAFNQIDDLKEFRMEANLREL